MSQPFLDNIAAVRDFIKKVLEDGPLYREYRYHFPVGLIFVPSMPPAIEMHCAHCEKITNFANDEYKDQTPARLSFTAEYKCRNCGLMPQRFSVQWFAKDAVGTFKKWGQLPAIDIQIPSAVANNLASSEVELYKKAVRLRAQNYGIGAMVYLRRVIENSMNSMLETLLALAMQDGVEPGLAEKLKKIQVSKRFDEKAEYAKVLLPPRLVRGGINPIDVLHDAFSEAVHALSDEESVDLFDNTRSVFNYLFAQLKVEMEAQAGFIKQLNEIAKRGTRPAPTPTGKEQSSEPAATVEASQ